MSDAAPRRRHLFRPAGAWLAALALACMAASPTARAAPDAAQILKASDAVRNPGRSYRVQVVLTEFQNGKRVDGSSLLTFTRTAPAAGRVATLVQFVQPERDAGKLMLKDGDDLWFFDPNTKASVRLSPQQRLMGQASNGDVVTVNFSRDYRASLLAQEEVRNGDGKLRQAYKLGLDAASADATYHRIELWVDSANDWPIKGLFYADSGRLLKTVYYRRYQSELGAERPTELVIIDGLNPQSVTLMRLSDFQARDLPASWFQRDYLPRFQPE